MKKLLLTLLALFPFILIGQPKLPNGFFLKQIFSNRTPVTMDFDPDGRIFVSDLTGQILLIENDTLAQHPVGVIPVDNTGERGLYGIAFDPDFEFNHYLYVYYSVRGENHNRLSRFKFQDDHINYEDEEVLINFGLTTAVMHNGGDIKFGADGKLYIAIGDGGMPTEAQSLSSLFGKILRVNSDGSTPTDNPFYSSNQGVYKCIYAYGLRNPFTFSFSKENRLFVNDVGESDYEEINNILPGRNYGWPTVEGKLENNGGVSPPDNYEDPVYTYSHKEGCAITGASFYDLETGTFPDEFKGKYFFGDYCNNTIKTLDPETLQVNTFLENDRPTTFIKVNKTGDLYFISFAAGSGSLWKIFYKTDGAPKISVQPVDLIAAVGESVTFSIGATGGDSLVYQWTMNGLPMPGASKSTLLINNLTLELNNTIFTCIIKNETGQIESNPAHLTVSDRSRPIVTIKLLRDTAFYAAGDTIIAKGFSYDAIEGSLPKESFKWSVEFHHDHHTHPILTNIQGVDSIGFVIPRIGETSSNVWYRIYLQSVNDAGLAQTAYAETYPRISTFVVKTSGDENYSFPIFIDGSLQMTPFRVTSVVGMTRNVSVFSNQIIDGYLYQFRNNDSQESSVTFNVPLEDTVLLFDGDFKKIYLGDGSGLLGKYYNKPLTFDGIPDAVRIDSRIDFKWGYQAPIANFNSDNFSIAWDGYINVPEDGEYTFFATSDDGIRLWIDSYLLIDEFKEEPVGELIGTKMLKAGMHSIKINYYEVFGAASIKLSWSSNSISKDILPSNILYTDYENKPADQYQVLVYPSPTSSNLNLELNNLYKENSDVFIYNLMGEVVFKKNMNNWIKETLDLTNLTSGLYVIKISFEDFYYITKFSKH